MKKIAALVMVLVISLALVACGQANNRDNSGMNIEKVTNDDGTTSEVKNGTEKHSFQVEENQTYEIAMSFNNKSGSVSAYIAKDGVKDNAIYSGADIPSGTFTVTANEPGEYEICYEASDYIGEYTYSVTAK